MKPTICCFMLLGLAVAIPALAEEEVTVERKSSEALEILKKVDAAAKAVKSVSYNATAVPSGIAENFMSRAEGKAVLVGWVGAMPAKFSVHIKTKDRESGEDVEMTGGGDGDSYFVIDHHTRKAYEDMDPGVLGSSGNTLRAIMMAEFVHDTPFDDEINADQAEYLGVETVNSEECHKIHVVYAGGQGKSTWYFSKNDYLPRRRVRFFSIPEQGEGTLEITVSDLKTDPAIDAGAFKLKLPEGYEQIDDFAP